MMNTILFFDRCNLTTFYILLTKELQGKVNVIHVAYSNIEAKQLEEAGISNYIDYQKEFSSHIESIVPTEDLLNEIDKLIICQSKGRFTLNGSIQSDRGFTILDYNESLLLACSHYKIWKNIFEKFHVDIMFHEPASLFMTYVASLLCKRQGGKYIYMMQVEGDKGGYSYLNIDGEDFSCKDIELKFNYYKDHPEKIDRARCEKYIDNFKKNYTVAFKDINNPVVPKWKLWYSSIRYKLSMLINDNRYDRLKNNIDYWILHNNMSAMKLYNLRQYKAREIRFSRPVAGERYFYYSIHLEPEATLLYLSGGFYTNQIKLIENIAASLPPGYFLYVKDHPHEYAYRKADDYERLMNVPNIRLIDQKIPGKRLIKDAEGVFSINGTAGFEALMLRKKVFCFGKSYYSIYPRVHYIENVREVRDVVYRSMKLDDNDSDEYYAYVYAYLSSLQDGFVAYFRNLADIVGVNEKENARIIAKDILSCYEK